MKNSTKITSGGLKRLQRYMKNWIFDLSEIKGGMKKAER